VQIVELIVNQSHARVYNLFRSNDIFTRRIANFHYFVIAIDVLKVDIGIAKVETSKSDVHILSQLRRLLLRYHNPLNLDLNLLDARLPARDFPRRHRLVGFAGGTEA
jgi:hypothetical protein